MSDDAIKRRIEELAAAEKQAWAHLNYIVGAREECERLMASMSADAMTTAPKLASAEDEEPTPAEA